VASGNYSEGNNNVLNKVPLKILSLFNRHTLRVILATYVSIPPSHDDGFITSGYFTTYPLLFEYLKIRNSGMLRLMLCRIRTKFWSNVFCKSCKLIVKATAPFDTLASAHQNVCCHCRYNCNISTHTATRSTVSATLLT